MPDSEMNNEESKATEQTEEPTQAPNPPTNLQEGTPIFSELKSETYDPRYGLGASYKNPGWDYRTLTLMDVTQHVLIVRDGDVPKEAWEVRGLVFGQLSFDNNFLMVYTNRFSYGGAPINPKKKGMAVVYLEVPEPFRDPIARVIADTVVPGNSVIANCGMYGSFQIQEQKEDQGGGIKVRLSLKGDRPFGLVLSVGEYGTRIVPLSNPIEDDEGCLAYAANVQITPPLATSRQVLPGIVNYLSCINQADFLLSYLGSVARKHNVDIDVVQKLATTVYINKSY